MRRTEDQGSAISVVTCATYRESLSAQLDGETPSVDTTLHLAACPDCARWLRDTPALLRPLRMQPADDVPDLAERILSAIIGDVPRPSFALTLTRAALMAVAILQASIGVLLLINDAGHAQHVTAESGAWNFAIGIAFATAALRPRAAYAVLPMVASLVLVLGYASLRDLADGAVTPSRVLGHVLIVAGLALVAALTYVMRRVGRRPKTVPAAVGVRGLLPR